MRRSVIVILGTSAVLIAVLSALEGLWALTIAMVGTVVLVGLRLRDGQSRAPDRTGALMRGVAGVAFAAVVIAVVSAFRNDWELALAAGVITPLAALTIVAGVFGFRSVQR